MVEVIDCSWNLFLGEVIDWGGGVDSPLELSEEGREDAVTVFSVPERPKHIVLLICDDEGGGDDVDDGDGDDKGGDDDGDDIDVDDGPGVKETKIMMIYQSISTFI